jgi:hypothetical protein
MDGGVHQKAFFKSICSEFLVSRQVPKPAPTIDLLGITAYKSVANLGSA